MNWNHWFVIIVLLLITALGGMAGFKTAIGELENLFDEQEREIAELEAQVQSLQEQLRPTPFFEPLEKLYISSGCGYRLDPMGGGTEALHHGIDLAASVGTPVRAVRDGIIKEHWVPPDGKYWKGHPVMGGLLVIDHGEFFAKYGHLSKTFVHEGNYVKAGQIIGLVGNTGISTGSHLHFEIVVNPLEYLRAIR